MKDKSIYEMNLHDVIKLDDDTTVSRVPGGWIYKYFSKSGTGHWGSYAAVFVSFNNEFQLVTL